MTELGSSQTAHHLALVLAAEARDHLRFRYFARRARHEGRTELAAAFDAVADMELDHGLHVLAILAELGDPVTRLPIDSAEADVRSALASERLEARTVYPRYAEIARREGLVEIADWLDQHAREDAWHAAYLERLTT